ncbi:MAG: RNA polymerase factor sigma-54 [Kiritimatiellae bacterium]|nr:RNA polymerase factor sigma-54 [Kiritimatiellia bacterium]
MALSGELRQSQTMTQTMTLAPQQRQSLHLLQLSLPDLRTELFNEMARNPVIEEIEPTLEKATISQKEQENAERERGFDSDYTEDDDIPGTAYTADADALERRQRFFDSQTREETLEEHLASQLKMSDIDPADYPLAEMLIGDLDDNGYFAGSIPDVMMVSGESEAKIRSLLAAIRDLDPPGCGATSIEECLLAQLDKLDGSPFRDDVRDLIARHHLADIAGGRIAAVERDLGMSHERYADVLSELRTLEPRPGRAFTRAGKSVAYVNPEVHAVNVGGRWTARVDDRSLPDIRISKRYLQMLEDPKTSKETKDYIRERIAAARSISEAVERRQDTISGIAQAILDAQPDFFTEGLKGLKPLTMQEIADKVGVHHTTVSRTVRDKYISTPKGTVELRKFFAKGIVGEHGEQIARTDVLDRLKALVDGEDKAHPLSDDRISELLKGEGYPVARRTVAKYRGQLGLPGAPDRRV